LDKNIRCKDLIQQHLLKGPIKVRSPYEKKIFELHRRINEKSDNDFVKSSGNKNYLHPSVANISPLVQNSHNSTLSFQLTANNAKQLAVNSNPYSNIPYEIQEIGKRIGADLDKITNNPEAIGTKRRRLISQSSATSDHSSYQPGS
jgi:hypothetical protein